LEALRIQINSMKPPISNSESALSPPPPELTPPFQQLWLSLVRKTPALCGDSSDVQIVLTIHPRATQFSLSIPGRISLTWHHPPCLWLFFTEKSTYDRSALPPVLLPPPSQFDIPPPLLTAPSPLHFAPSPDTLASQLLCHFWGKINCSLFLFFPILCVFLVTPPLRAYPFFF